MAFKKGKSGNPNGRPTGSTTKPKFSDFLSKEEIEGIVAKAKELALAGNENMIKLILEHNFGKAPQNVDLTSGGDPIKVVFDSAFKK